MHQKLVIIKSYPVLYCNIPFEGEVSGLMDNEHVRKAYPGI